MVLGEEGQISWEKVAYVVGGGLVGLIPGLWAYLLKRKEAESVSVAKKQRVRAKDETLEQAMYDHLFDKYKTMLEDLQTRVNGFEADRVTYLSENSKFKERCENQAVRIAELTTQNREQATRITELTGEVDKLSSRVQELEVQAGGV